VKKVPIKINVVANENQNLTARFTLFDEEYTVIGDILQSAKSSPLSISEIEDCFSKSDIFDAQVLVQSIGNVFAPKSALNAFRRQTFERAEQVIKGRYKHGLMVKTIDSNSKVEKFCNFKYVQSVEDVFDAENIVLSPEEYTIDVVKEFATKCKKIGVKGYLDLPNFALEKDIKLLKEIIAKTAIPIVVNNYYALLFDAEIVIGAGLNVYNGVCASEHDKKIITAESNVSTRIDFPYMTLRHCPLKNHGVCDCENCKYTPNYEYVAENGKRYKLKRKKMSTCTFYLVD
jgi:hypothetical protein